MRSIFKVTTSIALFIIVFTGCTKDRSIGGEFAHVVLFWLNNPDDIKDQEDFEKSLTSFIHQSKYVKTMHLGNPANTPREVVDNSYTYCMILTFASKDDQNAYQKENVHLKFIEESKHLWKEVKVFDSINMLQ